MSWREIVIWPEALPFLLLAPVVWVASRAIDARRERRLRAITGPHADRLTSDFEPRRRRLRAWVASSALLFALLALAQPMWGRVTRSVLASGADILVCLDVSRSMLAADVLPNRLERARSEIQALCERARGDRVGLVAFAGEARLDVPLTHDLDALSQLVPECGVRSVRRGGTDLASALTTALESLEHREGDAASIVLITDGEDLEAKALRAASACAERGIVVHCIGMGSTRGSKIAITTAEGPTFLKDRQGRDVVTTMDPTSLRAIATATGGDFVDGNRRAQPLLDLYERRILPQAREATAIDARKQRENRFQWPLLCAVLLWLFEFGMRDRRPR